MPQTTKIFRVFVSSTFSDMRVEREILQRDVFPKLEKLCRKNRAKFQAVDLRWGVNEESQLNQKTMEICLNEIARCQRISPKPNFIILLGNRYGWQPVPYYIPKPEMREILKVLSNDGKDLLLTWYRLDENAVPEEYVLQPREGQYREYSAWTAIERDLLNTLRSAVLKTGLNEDQKSKYFTSATHQEIITGALSPSPDLHFDPKDHIFAYLRKVINPPKGDSDYVKNWEDTDTNTQIQLPALKETLGTKLGDHCQAYPAFWDGKAVIPVNPKEFGNTVFEHLETIIKEQLQEIVSQDEVELEVANHQNLKESLISHFTGRKDELKKIAAYIEDDTETRVLNIVGESGSGKTSVMAQAIADAEEAQRAIFYRFLGTSSRSTNTVKMLQLLCTETASRFDTPLESLVTEEQQEEIDKLHVLREIFGKCLALANEQSPIIFFLDALDQLGESSKKLNFSWLPDTLPQHTKVVVSSLPDVAKKIPNTLNINLPGLPAESAKILLARWLDATKRKLTDDQQREVLTGFSSTGLPIYLKLAFEQAKNWHSYTPAKALPIDVPGILDEWFEALKIEHTEFLLTTVFQYMLAGKYQGLTEDEILDLLVLDKEYWQKFLNKCHPDHRSEVEEINKLPTVIWSRLYFDLDPYLAERDANGETLLCFYHRQFNELLGSRLLSLEDKEIFHKKIADYFDTRWQEAYPRALDELPYHLIMAQEQSSCSELLTNLNFIRLKIDSCNPEDLSSDYKFFNKDFSPLNSSMHTVREFENFLLEEIHILAEHPDLIYQQAMNQPSGSSPHLKAELYFKENGKGRPFILWDDKYDNNQCVATINVYKSQSNARCSFGLSPDGKKIAICSGDHLQIWDLEHITEIMTLTGHAELVNSCDFAPNGLCIASCSNDGAIKIWDSSNGLEISTLKGHSGPVNSVRFSPDNRSLVSCSDDKTIKIWSLESKTEQISLKGHSERVVSCDYAPTGQVIASVSRDHTFKLWNSLTGEVVFSDGKKVDLSTLPYVDWKISAKLGENECLSFSKDSKLVAIAPSREIKVYDLRNNSVSRIGNHDSTITCCDFSEDGKYLITGSADNTIILWDIIKQSRVTTFLGHNGTITHCKFALYLPHIISASIDGTIKVWKYETGDKKNLNQVKPVADTFFRCRIHRKKNPSKLDVYMDRHNKKLVLHDFTENLVQAELDYDYDRLNKNFLGISRDGKKIIEDSVTEDKKLRINIIDTCENKKISKTISEVQFEQDPEYITIHSELSNSGKYCIYYDLPQYLLFIYDITRQIAVTMIPLITKTHRILYAQFSPDESTVALFCQNYLLIYDIFQCNFTRIEVGSGIFCAFSPDGKSIIAAGANSLTIWDSQTGKVQFEFDETPNDTIRRCTFSPDSTKVVTFSGDELALWDILKGTQLLLVEDIFDYEFTTNSKYLAAISNSFQGNHITLYDLHTGNELTRFYHNFNFRVYDFLSFHDLYLSPDNRIYLIANDSSYHFTLHNLNQSLPLTTPIRMYDIARENFDSFFTIFCPWCGKHNIEKGTPGDHSLTQFQCNFCNKQAAVTEFRVNNRVHKLKRVKHFIKNFIKAAIKIANDKQLRENALSLLKR